MATFGATAGPGALAHEFVTTPGVLAVIDGVLAGILAAIAMPRMGMPGGTTVAVGVVVGVVTLGALITYQYRGAVRPRSRRRARFPDDAGTDAGSRGDAARSGDPARTVERTYLVLTLLTTLASSFIWGINTIFLLDAGLSNAEAFAANAFFTVGQVIFEVPTGVVADTRGRRFSYVLGAATLFLATLLYLVMWQVRAPLWGWAIASILLGPRLHVLLRRHRGVARRRAQGDRLHGPPRARLRAGAGRRRRGDARRDGLGRAHRPGDEPRRPVPDPGRDARHHDARGHPVHARPRVHAPARHRSAWPRCGTSSAARSTAASATRRSAG